MSEVTRVAVNPVPPLTDFGVAWFVKRTILAVAILCLSMGGIAWLLHASIDPTPEANAAEMAAPAASSAVVATGSIAKR